VRHPAHIDWMFAHVLYLTQNITMPCLLFSKIVPAFTSSNIAALGISIYTHAPGGKLMFMQARSCLSLSYTSLSAPSSQLWCGRSSGSRTVSGTVYSSPGDTRTGATSVRRARLDLHRRVVLTWSELATAVVLSICASPPFNGTKDSDLAVAYVSVFILVFSVRTRLFPFEGTH
jgi:hypothetical protein